MPTLTQERRAEAALSDLSLERPTLVCFVCTGNTCRSPMAEAVVNHLFRVPPVCTACDMSRVLSTPSVRATSAGLYGAGDPIAENAVRRAMLSRAKKSVLMLDSQKLGEPCMNTLCTLDEVMSVVSERDISGEFPAIYREKFL